MYPGSSPKPGSAVVGVVVVVVVSGVVVVSPHSDSSIPELVICKYSIARRASYVTEAISSI